MLYLNIGPFQIIISIKLRKMLKYGAVLAATAIEAVKANCRSAPSSTPETYD